MFKRFAMVCVCLFVLTVSFSGMASAWGPAKVELTGKEWTTTTEANVGIPSGGVRLNYEVSNEASSQQQLLYTINYHRDNGEIVPFTAGILNPGENKEERIFIYQPGKYTLTLTALRYGLPNALGDTPSCKATGTMTFQILGCFPLPKDLN